MSFVSQFDELINILEGAKKIPLSNNVIVNKEKIESIILKLKEEFPSEFRNSEQIISTRDEIISQAKAQADRIMEEGKKERDRLTSQEEVYNEAVRLGKEIILKAKERAVSIINRLNESLSQGLKSLKDDVSQIDKEIDSARKDFLSELKNMNNDIMNA